MHIVYTHISKILLTRKRELCRWRIRKAQKKMVIENIKRIRHYKKGNAQHNKE